MTETTVLLLASTIVLAICTLRYIFREEKTDLWRFAAIISLALMVMAVDYFRGKDPFLPYLWLAIAILGFVIGLRTLWTTPNGLTFGQRRRRWLWILATGVAPVVIVRFYGQTIIEAITHQDNLSITLGAGAFILAIVYGYMSVLRRDYHDKLWYDLPRLIVGTVGCTMVILIFAPPELWTVVASILFTLMITMVVDGLLNKSSKDTQE